MKHQKLTYWLAAILTLAACTGSSDNDVTLYGDAAITTFSLGTMNRYVDGVKSTYSGNTYSFHIDQVRHEIYNTDSLPMGTDVSRVVCNISAVNNGQVLIEDPDDSNLLSFYSSSDSIDFTSTRYLRVYASDGSGHSRYSVKVNVHQQDGETFVWTRMPDIPVMSGLKALCHGGRMYIFGNEGGQTRAYSTADGASWSAESLPPLTDADAWRSVIASKDSIYLMDSNSIYHTKDFSAWQSEPVAMLSADIQPACLIGSTTEELYAIDSRCSQIVTRYEGFHYWFDEERDADDMLPTRDFASVSYPMSYSDSTDYMLFAGNRLVGGADGSGQWRSAVWRKTADYSSSGIINILETEGIIGGKWTYIDRADETMYVLPALEGLQLVKYDDGILALGGKGLSDESISVCSAIYKSRDNGITWKPDSHYTMPPDDSQTGVKLNAAATSITAAVDSQSYLWIFCAGTGEAWRGRLNRLGWE